jgi:hypothetical protein
MASLPLLQPVPRSSEKRGHIYRTGFLTEGTHEAHRFPCCFSEILSAAEQAATYKGRPLLGAPRTGHSTSDLRCILGRMISLTAGRLNKLSLLLPSRRPSGFLREGSPVPDPEAMEHLLADDRSNNAAENRLCRRPGMTGKR